MQVKYTLTETEYGGILKLLDSMETVDLCREVSCPECHGDSPCENCPMHDIQDQFDMGLNALVEVVRDRLYEIAPNQKKDDTTLSGQMVRKMIEQYEKERGAK